jgi:gamma-glutamyl:cysteine ligase YbdK (ATP-grasp superfamily)
MTHAERHLFDAYGIELEYMIVDRDDLSVTPISEVLLSAKNGRIRNERRRGRLMWSNELVSHVIELKVTRPEKGLAHLDRPFQKEIKRINSILERHNAILMPTAMHPFMDPFRDTLLWSYGDRSIYTTYHQIFGCHSHGFANLQSSHLNLPFKGDDEFGRLHAAARIVLPIIPAISASSPICGGAATGSMDTRINMYRKNQSRVPSITGDVIPEPVYTEHDYRRVILEKIYADMEPLDPKGLLCYEWLNSRGAIARFERDTIEIRLTDIQENPSLDIAIAAAVSYLMRALAEERLSAFRKQKIYPTKSLVKILDATVLHGDDADINNKQYCGLLGLRNKSYRAIEIWREIIDKLIVYYPDFNVFTGDLEVILEHGTLAKRILKSIGVKKSEKSIKGEYRRLCECLDYGEAYIS